MLKAVRTHFGMKSRRPKKSTLPVKLGKGSAPIVEVPINEHPFYLALEVFERPQILKRPKHWPEREIPTGHYNLHTRMYMDPHTAKRHAVLGNAGVAIKISPGNLEGVTPTRQF
jgi:hypothetical protein